MFPTCYAYKICRNHISYIKLAFFIPYFVGTVLNVWDPDKVLAGVKEIRYNINGMLTMMSRVSVQRQIRGTYKAHRLNMTKN